MSNWKLLSLNSKIPAFINSEFGAQNDPRRIVYPDLDDGSDLVLATDYSGEHEAPEFRVLGFLLTTQKSIESVWEPARVEIRKKYLPDGRRMSFKKLNDGARINAVPSFLKAASLLNGVLAYVAVEKTFDLKALVQCPLLQYNWVRGPLEKLIEICVFGAGLINGLRSPRQNVAWMTDDDAIVVKDAAKADALAVMKSYLFEYPNEQPTINLSVASELTDDGLRGEDLLAIPDLAAGTFSETLMKMEKKNMPTSGSGPGGHQLFLQTKSSLIHACLGTRGIPLKNISCLVRRPDHGSMRLSFGLPFNRPLMPGESAEGAIPMSEKWRKSLEAELAKVGADPKDLLKGVGIDLIPADKPGSSAPSAE